MTNKYIAMTGLSLTENLGSQMWNFATLYAISRRTGHRIIFFTEHANQGKGLRLHYHFHGLPLELISMYDLDESERTVIVYPVTRDVTVDSNVYLLDSRHNYNFTGLFISYKYWYSRRDEVAQMYQFDPATVIEAQSLIERTPRARGRQIVAVHVRRCDYINGIFVNATREYYDAAFAHFDDATVNYLIFSDDLPWCRATFQDKTNISYSDASSPIVDMCAMSLCDHNIIANSSFSFWGAFLNRNPNKRVICPAKTLRSDRAIPHVNYAWYPDEFIGVDAGNA